MGWNQEKGGYYCDRCETNINMSSRNTRFWTKGGISVEGGDPYISINHVAFDKPVPHGAKMYCFDCEPLLMGLLEEFNKYKGPTT